MREHTLKQEIIKFIEAKGKAHGGEIEDLGRSLGYMASTAKREAQRLAGEGKLIRYLVPRINGKGRSSVAYMLRKIDEVSSVPKSSTCNCMVFRSRGSCEHVRILYTLLSKNNYSKNIDII